MKLKRRKLDAPLPFVSMADIAFNLVLFFIILARTQDDRSVQWSPAKAADTRQVPNARATVTVDKESRIYLNGRPVGVRDLPDGIGQLLGDRPADERAVFLKVHKEALAATFEPILEAVGQAGGEVVHILEEER